MLQIDKKKFETILTYAAMGIHDRSISYLLLFVKLWDKNSPRLVYSMIYFGMMSALCFQVFAVCWERRPSVSLGVSRPHHHERKEGADEGLFSVQDVHRLRVPHSRSLIVQNWNVTSVLWWKLQPGQVLRTRRIRREIIYPQTDICRIMNQFVFITSQYSLGVNTTCFMISKSQTYKVWCI